ncbi:MAG: Holliday junction branch migration protein RuvA [Prevotellaceae bacterium]|jgi:Holliday junction DNA helicase RuvA|nr:Holliday junction branch migration protein RuvA [Prevotellaceae bacterium]
MIEYIKGEIIELSPAHVVVETGGIGYFINITLPVYSQLTGKSNSKLYIYEAIREDAHLLYGFITTTERELFLHLLSVSGVGASTARMIMSSLSVAEIRDIILSGNAAALKSVKGIGLKTAERIIVDLKSKMLKIETEEGGGAQLFAAGNTVKNEAVSALEMLGFNRQASQKAVDKILQNEPSSKVEQVIKLALKMI